MNWTLTQAALAMLLVLEPAECIIPDSGSSPQDEFVERMSTGKPSGWPSEVEKLNRHRDHVVAFLCQQVRNTSLSADDRRTAVDLLASLATTEAILFLIDNQNLALPAEILGDSDREKLRPCRRAVVRLGWRAIPELLVKSKANGSEAEAEGLALLLTKICGNQVAQRILEDVQTSLSVDSAKEKQALKRVQDRLSR